MELNVVQNHQLNTLNHSTELTYVASLYKTKYCVHLSFMQIMEHRVMIILQLIPGSTRYKWQLQGSSY